MTDDHPETVALRSRRARQRAGRRCASGSPSRSSSASSPRLAVGVGALYAYDSQYTGRVLPGVSVGGVDLSGLAPAAAAAASSAPRTATSARARHVRRRARRDDVDYAKIGRGPDVDAMVAEAMAVGRQGNAVERVVADARTALRGVDAGARSCSTPTRSPSAPSAPPTRSRASRATRAVCQVDQAFTVVPRGRGPARRPGRPSTAALAELGDARRAGRDHRTRCRCQVTPPTVTTDEATTAKDDADLIARADRARGQGQRADDHRRRACRGSRSRRPPTAGTRRSSTGPASTASLKTIAKNVDRSPERLVQARAAADHRRDRRAARASSSTSEGDPQAVQDLLEARAAGAATAASSRHSRSLEPALTTAEAKAARPKMRKISKWTTYFPISEKNGFGANIWIPARLINGYVVGPGETFDFWDAVGPVTRAKGYRDGGAIINGKTEPQGALAGGICSCSTTLFNAALRAGYEMGARRNHYYYIDRYPIGLDATVFNSGSGSNQTMSFTNDTEYPVLIRGMGSRSGGSGYVRFDIYSVPTGRKVVVRDRTERNVRPATDIGPVHLEPAGRRPSKRIEYPVDGYQVSVTRTVRERSGQGRPPGHVVLELRADHRDHARSAAEAALAFLPAADPGPRSADPIGHPP